MKTLLCLLAAAALLCGCNQNEARIKKLETKINELASAVENQNVINKETVKILEASHQRASNLESNFITLARMKDPIVQSLIDNSKLQAEILSDHEDRLGKLGKPSVPVSVPALRASTATRNGVPIAIYNQIAADAAKKWGSNYEMQDYEIKQQTEAYRKLHP